MNETNWGSPNNSKDKTKTLLLQHTSEQTVKELHHVSWYVRYNPLVLIKLCK